MSRRVYQRFRQPSRLLDLRDEESRAERELLASSRLDAPRSGAEKRALAALGLASTSTLAMTSLVEAGKHTLRYASLTKIVGVVAVAGFAGTVTLERLADRHATASASHVSASTAAAATAYAPSSVPTSARGSVPDVTPVPIPTIHPSTPVISAVSSPIVVAPPRTAVGAAPKPLFDVPATEHAGAVENEIAWIDRAQLALAGDPAKARSIVDAYRHEVTSRAYDEEATAIAAEASAKLGDRDRAVREANAFLAAYPRSAYRDRVSALLANP